MSAAGFQFQLSAQTSDLRSGRACPLGTGISDINLFRYCQSIACFDPEVSDRMDPTLTLCDVLSGYADTRAKEAQKSVTNCPF
jgi:hypothetical protein